MDSAIHRLKPSTFPTSAMADSGKNGNKQSPRPGVVMQVFFISLLAFLGCSVFFFGTFITLHFAFGVVLASVGIFMYQLHAHIFSRSLPALMFLAVSLLLLWYVAYWLILYGAKHWGKHKGQGTFSFPQFSDRKYCNAAVLHDTIESVTPSTDFIHRTQAPRQKAIDIFILSIGALPCSAFRDHMPMTRKVLEDSNAIIFDNFHHRQGATRGNMLPLLLGEQISYNCDYRKTPSCTFNVTAHDLNQWALWNVATQNGYSSMYGSTACNQLFGLDHLETKDGLTFHDTGTRTSQFGHLFPSGSYYGGCNGFKKFRSGENLIDCQGQGPYHHTFYDYYIKFREKNLKDRPLFTHVHMYETHGQEAEEAWLLDYHTSNFLTWMIAREDALIVFMGDYSLGGTTTALAMSVPTQMQERFQGVRELTHKLVIHNNLYRLMRDLMNSQETDSPVKNFEAVLKNNRCDQYDHLKLCKITEELE